MGKREIVQEEVSLDPTALNTLLEYDQSATESRITDDLLKIFFDITPGRLKALEHAARNGDTKTMGLIAHSLKTSCAYLGGRKLMALCLHVEVLSGEGDSTQAESLVDQMKIEYLNLKNLLEQKMFELKNEKRKEAN
jgi:HPt (histidine-containing phosphotransfer) domain-containing protein